MRIRTALLALLLAAGAGFCEAQSQAKTARKGMDASPTGVRTGPAEAAIVPMRTFAAFGDSTKPRFPGAVADFLDDQKQIWSSPSRVRWSDTAWLVPLGGVTAGLLVTDRQYSASLDQNPATLQHYRTISNIGVASLIGASASLYLFSYPAHREHWRETGLLAGKAALHSLATVEALKYSFRRERPYQRNGSGAFFQGGSSFPSEHSALAWSVAGVVAHEYPGTVPRLFAYGMASAVSFSRIRTREHFPSDVVIGSLLGYLISQNVYRRHHDVELGGAAWESPHEFVAEHKDSKTPSFTGSPYVPLDSWIYPALERLGALGYVRTSILGLRPWTRLECVRLLGEAEERQPDADDSPEVQALYQSLSHEFSSERDAPESERSVYAQVESVYARTIAISGKPLTDNQHFGQTLLNDYGRPYQEGFNSLVGSSAWTTLGPFVIYARGEYQSAPASSALPPAALDFIRGADALPPNPPRMPVAATGRFQILDAYVAMNVANWQISFGKQSLWWGPGNQGAMLLTNNAAPLGKMFRIDRVSPFQLPSVLRYLGEIRAELFLAQVAGQHFINNSVPGAIPIQGPQGQYGRALSSQPFLMGGKVSIKVTPNFEIGMSKTSLYGGPGNPLTAKTYLQSSLSLHANGFALGDGRAALDFSYRIPKLRDWISVYGDALQEDEISPVNRPYKAAFQTGMYLARFPWIPKLDLRIEGGTTSPINFPSCSGCYYGNVQYLNGYTNGGQLMGTWLGRAAQGEWVRSTYWISPQNKIGVELRHRQIDRQFLPRGGSQNDAALHAEFGLHSGFRVSGTVQYERWQIPLLAAGRQSNLSTLFEISYWPRVRAK